MAALKVGVAMSGGVDSTMAAISAAGAGVPGPRVFHDSAACQSANAQQRRVQEVADRLSIPLTQIDLRDRFAEQVIGYFIQ